MSIAASEYYVVCANTATTADSDLDLTPDTNLIQNGDPDAIACGWARHSSTLSATTEHGCSLHRGLGVGLSDTAVAAEGISRCPDGTDSDRNNVDFALKAITPGATNACVPPPPPPFGACGDDEETRIHTIQGSEAASPSPAASARSRASWSATSRGRNT